MVLLVNPKRKTVWVQKRTGRKRFEKLRIQPKGFPASTCMRRQVYL